MENEFECQRLLSCNLDKVSDIEKLRAIGKELQDQLSEAQQQTRTERGSSSLVEGEKWITAECDLQENNKLCGLLGTRSWKVLTYDPEDPYGSTLRVKRLREIKSRPAVFYPLINHWNYGVDVYVDPEVTGDGIPYRVRVVSDRRKVKNLDFLATIRVKGIMKLRVMLGEVSWLCVLLPTNRSGSQP